MERYREQLASAAAAVAFKRGGGFLWRGTSPRSLPHRIVTNLAPAARRALTLILLRESLYDGFYCRGGLQGEDFGSDDPPMPGGAAGFVSELSRANAGSGSCERGWSCLRRDGNALTIRKAGLTLTADVGDVATDAGGPSPGGTVLLRVAKELLSISPGYYFAIGDEAWAENSEPIVRVYWNLVPAGAVRLIRAATTLLNEARIAFRIKTLDNPAAYTRCDAAVLYFRRDDYGAVSPHLGAIHRDLSPFLKPPVPAFTKELAPGLGLAEDPASGDSFGLNRCQLVAEGLLRARDAGQSRAPARIDIVEGHLGEMGVDLRRPYLNPGSTDRYDFTPSSPRIGFPWRRSRDRGDELLPSELLQAASRIGERLASSAIWVGDRVAWAGPDPSPERAAAEPGSRNSALGPDLYAGTSGIALFLAELSLASGSPAMRSLALSAADHALTRVEAGSSVPGLFDGWSGAALAGARIGLLLDEPELLSRAGRVRRWIAQNGPCDPFDLISGRSGLILALLFLSDLLHDERLRNEAVGLGDSLLVTAERDGDTLSWRAPDAGNRGRNLTGFSHGAAGAAYSLIELFRATGEARFREGAEAAFAYEQGCFSAPRANWPDLRKEAASSGRSVAGAKFPSHWCHGAAGIALSRLRACEVLGSNRYEEQARVALGTAEREAERRLSHGTGDLSLCHGLAGDADVLLCGSHALAPAGDPTMPSRLGAAIIQRLGLLDEESPAERHPLGLMSGLAGAGYLLLRLRDERVPSVLMLRRETFSVPTHRARRSKFSASHTSGC